MTLQASLRTGAILGAAAGLGLGGIAVTANGDKKNFIRMTTIGLVYGVALGALGHYVGQAAVIGAILGLVTSSP